MGLSAKVVKQRLIQRPQRFHGVRVRQSQVCFSATEKTCGSWYMSDLVIFCYMSS